MCKGDSTMPEPLSSVAFFHFVVAISWKYAVHSAQQHAQVQGEHRNYLMMCHMTTCTIVGLC